MSARTLSSERDRKMTILLVPFMSCSAKLPIYGFIAAALFEPAARGWVVLSLYLLGMVVGVLYALALKRLEFHGEPVPFVMELPNYRLPSAKSVARLVWDKAKGFIQKAFTVVFIATLVVWFLQTFDASLSVAESPDSSLLAAIGGVLAPLFAPLGFGDWRASTALLTGFMAKESVVSTLTVLLGGDVSLLPTIFTPATAYAFLVFTLLYAVRCGYRHGEKGDEWSHGGEARCRPMRRRVGGCVLHPCWVFGVRNRVAFDCWRSPSARGGCAWGHCRLPFASLTMRRPGCVLF